jgi:hypothetical protein
MAKKPRRPSVLFPGDVFKETIAAGKAWLRKWAKTPEGAICPCCKRKVKIYPRIITSTMSFCLIIFARCHETVGDKDGFVHNPSLWLKVGLKAEVAATLRGDFAKLRYWGLIEEKPPNPEDDKPSSGYFRITKLGLDFVHRRCSVPHQVYVYNKVKLGEDASKRDTVDDCLRQRFSYHRLMTAPIEGGVGDLFDEEES